MRFGNDGFADQAGSQIEYCKILLIDCDGESRDALASTLGELGYAHECVDSSFAGLKLLKADAAIGVIVTRVEMPDIHAADLTRELIARHADGRPLATIWITGSASYETAVTALRLGVNDLLAEPIGSHDLARALREAVRIWRNRKGLIQALADDPLSFAADPANLALAEQVVPETIRSAFCKFADGMLFLSRERERMPYANLFGDPMWDMMMELACAKAHGQVLSVSAVCAAASAPQTTTLRGIRSMESAGVVRRWDDPRDRRRKLVELNDFAFNEVLKLFSALRQYWREVARVH